VERAAVSGSNTSQNQIGILALLCKNGSAAISAEYVAVRGSNISRKKTHLGALTQQRKRGRQCLACGCPWQQYKSEKIVPWRSHATTEARPSVRSVRLSAQPCLVRLPLGGARRSREEWVRASGWDGAVELPADKEIIGS